MSTSPTARTLKLLRAEGYLCEVVERWNPYARIRQDLFGFIDVLAVSGLATVGIQATDGSDHARRRKKILGHKNAGAWLNGGARQLEVWSWDKQGPRGKRKLWTVRREAITLDMLE
jgi:hypothetical protein